MYIINKEENNITQLEKKTFSELKFREREHLQEWIAKNPASLGEELLIIQKEFSGFNETNERLDLLALDKLGNLVIIENKLDDSGRDVTWQAIKYASYCSSLTKQEIVKIYQEYLGQSVNAEEKLGEFLNIEIEDAILNQGSTSQKIILVASNFRKEVTSSVLWLMNFNIHITCIKTTPYVLNDNVFLNFEQILPTKDTEEFSISMASKAKEEIKEKETQKNRHIVRRKFWEMFLEKSNDKNGVFSNISPSKETWLSKGIGMSGVSLNVVATHNYCKSEISINKGVKNSLLNKQLYNYIFKLKDDIENNFGDTLIWKFYDATGSNSTRIYYELENVDIFNNEDWNKMIDFLIDSSIRLEKAFREPIKKLNNYSKTIKQ